MGRRVGSQEDVGRGKDLGLLGKWVLIEDKGMCGVYDCEWREINEKKAKDRTLQRSFI